MVDSDGSVFNIRAEDPSALTTKQLQRENLWLRELIETRIDGMDKAIDLLQQFADRTPTTMDVQHEVKALREVTTEMIQGIRTQIQARDIQISTAAKDVKSAVDAAFAAAKEAVSEQNKSNALSNSKTEATFTKQIDMLGDTIKTNTKGMEDKIGDIKERLTIIESRTSVSDPSTQITLAKLGEQVARLGSSSDVSTGRSSGMLALWGLILGGIGFLVGASALIGLIVKIAR